MFLKVSATMTDFTLTETESSTLRDTGRVVVVRPLERLDAQAYAAGLHVDGPHRPGDTLPCGAKVKSVEAKRLRDAPLADFYRPGKSDRKPEVVFLLWDDSYGHRPDWRYEANPWVWLVEVEA